MTEERYDPEFPRVHWSSGSIADESEALALLEQVSSTYCRDRTAFWDSVESLDYTAVAYDVVDYRLLGTEELQAQFTADGSCIARGLNDEERTAVEDETHVLYWKDDGLIGVERAIQTLPDVEAVRPPRDEPREMDTWGPGTLVAEAYAVRQWIAISLFAEHTEVRQLGSMLKRLLQEYEIPPVAFQDRSAYKIAVERGYFN